MLGRRQLFMRCAGLCASLWAPSLLTACSQNPQPYRSQIFVFGTQVDILIYHDDTALIQTAIGKINADFQQFHHEWHAWEKGGILSKINQAFHDEQPLEIPNSVKNFILYSQQLSQQSGYLFDPGIGQLIALWGFHSENWQGPPPSDEQIQNWLSSRPSIADLYVKQNQIHSRNPNVQLDFGGNAKGLALDLALKSLEDSGIHSALVSIGGDMKALGLKPKQQPWQVAIQNPKNPQTVMASLPLFANESVVTSGTYQRYFDWQGTRYSHLINPNTGRPVEVNQSFASVTVVHEDATRADAAASALLIAGPTNWQTIAKQMQIESVMAIDNRNQLFFTPKMQQRISVSM